MAELKKAHCENPRSPKKCQSMVLSCFTSIITNDYDSVARQLGTWLKTSTGTALDSATYGYNAANQRTAFTNAAGTYYQYTYDNISQLKIADSPANTEDRGYTYDAAWNLNYRTNNGTLQTFKVDNKNQM